VTGKCGSLVSKAVALDQQSPQFQNARQCGSAEEERQAIASSTAMPASPTSTKSGASRSLSRSLLTGCRYGYGDPAEVIALAMPPL
jgi:hypothetical protein